MVKLNSWYLYFVAMIVNLLAFSSGLAKSWSSPVLPKLQLTENNPLGKIITTSEASLLTAILNIGNALGPLVAGKLCDKYGRKLTMVIIASPIVFAYGLLAYATNIYVFYAARVVKGLGVGSCLVVLQLYFSEVSESTNRGRVGCLMSVFYALGMLSSYVIGPHFTIKVFSLLCIVPLMLFFTMFSFIPESPLYLVLRGDRAGAEKSLMRLRSQNELEVENEFIEIIKYCEKTKQGSVKDIFRSAGLRRSFSICVGLFMFQQLTGVSVVVSYLQSIFEAAGDTTLSPTESPIVIGGTKFVVTIFTSLVVEKCGRRLLLTYSELGAGISFFILAIYFYLQEQGFDVTPINFLPLTCMISYIISCGLGVMPIPWIILGELFPPNVKSSATSIASFINFMAAFMVTVIFPHLVDLIGMGGAIGFFGCSAFLGVFFTYFTVPETKGMSLYQIQEMLDEREELLST
ncbi:unnamed protein product [Brassicogethes aeneus]|uniref:Uncharacterized protein n=1 Tax=Brassicogethes aeneus TaxID=1431903 RepID=A0A9P0B3K2_BRAAE|nr:unnamed protein product [Brassicogethes aeneus]